jgi:hypothetical protein
MEPMSYIAWQLANRFVKAKIFQTNRTPFLSLLVGIPSFTQSDMFLTFRIKNLIVHEHRAANQSDSHKQG